MTVFKVLPPVSGGLRPGRTGGGREEPGLQIDPATLRRFALFGGLDDAALARTLARATCRRIARDEAVFEQGEAASRFYVLLDGRLMVWQVTVDGRQVIVRVVHPGDLFGIARALRRADYPGTARAVVDSLVLAWPMSEWDGIVLANPHLAVTALQTIGQRLDEAHTRLREMSTQEVERRVAHTVLRLIDAAGRPVSGGVAIDFPISRQDIAEMAGTTLHTVSRILSAWDERKLVICGRQKLTIRDRSGLERIAEPDT